MKKYFSFLVLFLYGSLFSIVSDAQVAKIITIAGTGAGISTGDGGPATAASINHPNGLVVDGAGATYVTDCNGHRIRRISASGIITTICGTGSAGLSGDGGSAVSARIKMPIGIIIDGSGNIIFADYGNSCIRKVSPAGIITRVAGNGGAGYSGDGGAATAAKLNCPTSIALDASGNLLIADYGNHVIRKVTPAGIISTIAGTGTAGYSGDGGAVAAATLNKPYGVRVYGPDIFITDYGNNVVRKVNASGIITTVAGNGTSGYSGDGGPATNAQLYAPEDMIVDPMGDMYVADLGNHRVRKLSTTGFISTIAGTGASAFGGDGGLAIQADLDSPAAFAYDSKGDLMIADFRNNRIRKLQMTADQGSDSIVVFITNYCSGPEITIVPKNYMAGMNVKTFFGDGSSVASTITSSGWAVVSHNFAQSGTFTIMHILYNGTTPIDTLRYSYKFAMCKEIPIQFYIDANSNCMKDAGEKDNHLPLQIKVDSNGVTLDTVSATRGISYIAYGNPGDIYTLKVISVSQGLVVACPSANLIKDTIRNKTYNAKVTNLGLACSTTPGHDLCVNTSFRAGVHHFGGTIILDNLLCTPPTASVTMQLSAKYTTSLQFHPAPTSIAGNMITWDISTLSSTSKPYVIKADMEKTPGVLLPYGDTVMTNYAINPVVGDVDPSNNAMIRIDDVQSGYDPNDIAVSPGGCLAPGTTKLTYTIRFENTGNDTAFNIYVLDTLPNNLDPKSLRIVTATAAMDISINKIAGYNIVKFDFPNINLLDSSHHGLNSGMVVYNISMNSGLGSGTVIPNRAGIYFDDNPVVLTNTVENIYICPNRISDVHNTNAVDIYPNPATDHLLIKMPGRSYSSVNITNSMGQVLIQQPIYAVQEEVDIKALPPGLYYIILKGEQGSVVKKFVKL
ncbi:MAG: S-layer protein [Flavipsychrobacter sp.]|nr:S-layer protein [Flavipsychrobacter sp.]